MSDERDIIWWRRRCEVALGVPATEGNTVEILRNGVQIFPAMLEAIERSERSIDLLTFIYWEGEIGRRFAEALADRAAHGVRVRVLLDAVGARKIGDELTDLMSDAGCDVRRFRPIERDGVSEVANRTHRKILVCDEAVGFTGGVGIADVWQGDARSPDEWRDTHLRVVGPAVDGLRAAFIDNWVETGPEILDDDIDLCAPCAADGDALVQVVSGAGGIGQSAILTLFLSLFRSAQRSIELSTAYFTPTDEVLDALVDAAERGVEVDVVVPGPHADKNFMRLASEATFATLLEAGVRVHCFQPTMLHTKIAIIDRTVATVGSANLDARGSGEDDEVNLVLFDASVVEQLVADFEHDCSRCDDIDLDSWAERGLVQRAKERVVDAVSGIL